MSDQPSTRLRSISIVSMVSLSLLGLSATVWGAPPEPEPVTETAPVAPETPPAGEAGPVVDEAAANVPAASSLRSKMETGMSSIGELASEARNDEDLVRATCVLEKQDRANDVMDLGTSELLVIRDPNTTEQARTFALEKLDAASTRIDKLVSEAKSCAGEAGPEDTVDITNNEADEPSDIPILDPSTGLGDNPVPPPMDGGWPPAASPIE
jgi:hypothetical protein